MVNGKADDETARDEARNWVRDARANFEDSIRRAFAAGYSPTLDVGGVLIEFDRIEAEIGEAPVDDLETLQDNADRLERLRAYVYPNEEVVIEGKSAFAALSQWGVPSTTLATLQTDVMGLLGDPSPNVARGALCSLFAKKDYWAWYVDQHADFMQRVAWSLVGLEALALAFTLNRFVYGDVILGFIGAGVCGALVSVLSKMPALMADAESNAYLRRILMRIGTGVAAAVIGGGFLASGVVTITIPVGKVTITDMIESCGKDARLPLGVSSAPPPVTGSGAAAAGVQPAAQRAHCTTGSFLLLLALGLVLGFSERALTSFEDRIFPTGQGQPK